MSSLPDFKATIERQIQKRRLLVELLLTSKHLWEAAQLNTLTHFLKKYTLHDSNWIGVWFDPPDEKAILAINWDTFWTQGQVPYQTGITPTLLIRLNKLLLYYYDKKDEVKDGSEHISSAKSRTITIEERDEFLASFSGNIKLASSGMEYILSEDLVFTTLSGDIGQWHFLHCGQVELLCLSEEGQPISIPSI